jgi:polyisoprenoid-binding protein YceI
MSRPALLPLIALTLLIALPAHADRGEWGLLDESVVRFTCTGDAIDEPAKGRFGAVSGRVAMDPDDLSQIRGAVEVLLTSIRTADSGWDAMFRAAHFLAIDEHPRARFELYGVSGAERITDEWQRIELEGRLTVKGVNQEIEVPGRVRRLAASGDQPERIELLATFPLKWSEHDISVPRGSTRQFAGDGARVRMRLVFSQRRT